MWTNLFKNWNLIRLIRIALGLFILAQAIMSKDILIGVLAILFLIIPIFNIGCSANRCAIVPPKRNQKNAAIIFEEVK